MPCAEPAAAASPSAGTPSAIAKLGDLLAGEVRLRRREVDSDWREIGGPRRRLGDAVHMHFRHRARAAATRRQHVPVEAGVVQLDYSCGACPGVEQTLSTAPGETCEPATRPDGREHLTAAAMARCSIDI